MSSKRSVRWGFTRRSAAAILVGAVAVPVLSAAPALAGPAPAPAPAPKGKITVMLDQWGDPVTDKVSKALDGRYRSEQDPGSLFTLTTAIGARKVWPQKDASGRALTGQGVTVALLDSGIAPVAGLDGAGKVVNGPDLSLENGTDALRNLDTFGHGTHLAGIIAGEDPVDRDPRSGEIKNLAPTVQLGVAPDATLLPLKLATANGSTDVSQVIAALDWVSQHAHDDQANIRVVNLSFGTDSLQPYQVDPLAAAAENAWRHGIVVVVSAGNEGQEAARLTDPAMDPYVIAVGASDPQQTVKGWATPAVAAFTNSGTAERHVDLLAPGKSITSLRDPGSSVDQEHPEGRVAGDLTGRLFRGSGTSQAAAVVSGAAALLVQANPSLTPDQVKAALVRTATPLAAAPVVSQGAGQLNVEAAVALVRAAAKPGAAQTSLRAAVQTFAPASGTGSLEAARGGSHLVDLSNGDELSGEVDVQGRAFRASAWAQASAASTAWTGGVWNSARWSGDAWSSARWSASSWQSARWSSDSWSSARWSDSSWDSARWSSARWSSARWSDASWSSARWSDSSWDSARWSSARWS